MAQSFVGSNNLPLLVASGQFGTRLQVSKRLFVVSCSVDASLPFIEG
jgi:hypothetical protein